MTVSGPLLEPNVVHSDSALRKMEADAMAAAQNAPTPVASESAPVPSGPDAVAATDTPNGFVLWNPGVRDSRGYTYNSSNWGLNHQRCNTTTGCVTIDRWTAKLEEYVYGGTSRRWLLTGTMTKDFGTTGVSFSYSYYCGRNVTLGNDQLCAGGGADHSASGGLNPPLSLNKSFGSASSNRVFPMVSMTALWSTGKRATVAFRGWDVCNNNSGTIKLCTSAK